MAPTPPLTRAERVRQELWKRARQGRRGPEIRADKRRFAKALRKLTKDKRGTCARLGISGKRYRELDRRNRLAHRLAKEFSNG